MRAYKARIRAMSGLLLGGVKEHVSSPFETREQAEAWLAVVIQGNREAGRDVDGGQILTVMASRRAVVSL
jgi:hypothetical protein